MRTGPRHSFVLAVVLLAIGAALVVSAVLLWSTEIPSDLELPQLDPNNYFTQRQLERTADYERFYYVLWPFSVAATIGALIVLIRLAPRWARVIGLGRVGTGVVIGMLTLTVLWFVGLPFDIAGRWWRERHGLTRGNWFDWLTEPWFELLGQAVTAFLLIVILLALAGRFPRRWWLVMAPILLVTAAAVTFAYGGLVALDSHPIRSPELRREARQLGRQLGSRSTPVEVQEVQNLTRQANAMAVGLGPSERIVLWDTLLDGRFDDGEVRFVLAHEFGHIVRDHLWKGLAWFAVITFPLLGLLAWITGRRGGLRDPALPSLRAARAHAPAAGDNAAPERPLTAVRERGRLGRVAGDPRSRRGPRPLPGVRHDEPRRSEPAHVGLRHVRHASDADAADRDDGGLEGEEPLAARARPGYAASSPSSNSGRFRIPSVVCHFDHESSIASRSSRMNLGDMFTRETTTPGTSPSSTSWSMRAKVMVNS